MENCIYRFLDINKKLLYIGKAKNLEERLSNHNHLPIECYEKNGLYRVYRISYNGRCQYNGESFNKYAKTSV